MTDFTATRDDATSALIGAVLLVDTALDICVQERIRPQHFSNHLERLLYQGMLDLAAKDEPIDEITLAANVEPRWPDTATNTAAALIQYYRGTPVPAIGNLRAYCRIVRDHAWFGNALDAVWDAADALERQDRQSAISALSRVDSDDQAAPKRDAAAEFITWYESETKGIPLPFPILTEAVGGGLQAGEVTILGGWPGMGKTFFAKDMMLTARTVGARCHEYANEMSGARLTARLVSSLCGIPATRIRNRDLDSEEWGRVLAILNALPYETTPTAGWSVEEYCRDMRRNRWDMAVIDTVTNLPCKDTSEWDRACTMLADTAAQTKTQLVLLSQLNLARDTGQVKPPPTGRDLRNTGSWYMRGRVVMFVHRDQEVMKGTDLVRALPDGHIRTEKATHGEPEKGFMPVTFNPTWLRFDALADYSRPLEIAA